MGSGLPREHDAGGLRVTPEGKLAAYLVRLCKDYGIQQRKLSWEGRVGAPDRFLFMPGAHCFIELKSPNGKLSAVQKREISRMRENGLVVHVARSEDDVDEIIKDLLWKNNDRDL